MIGTALRTIVTAGCLAAGGAACASASVDVGSTSTTHHSTIAAPTTAATAPTAGALVAEPLAAPSPDRVVAGPQGAVPQFVVECGFSHHLADDPIVKPGQAGRSHLHAFFGNVAINATSTATSIGEADTTCDDSLDRASYWVPALLRRGEVITPKAGRAYYRPGPGVDPATVQPYPFGLEVLAGDPHSVEVQPVSVVAWTCGSGIRRDIDPPTCPTDQSLSLVLTFPDCWNGTDLASPDNRAHMSYSTQGLCPTSHPVAVPQLQFIVDYGIDGDATGLELSSGGVQSGHGDFLNAWDPGRLAREIRTCLHRNAVCGIAGND